MKTPRSVSRRDKAVNVIIYEENRVISLTSHQSEKLARFFVAIGTRQAMDTIQLTQSSNMTIPHVPR